MILDAPPPVSDATSATSPGKAPISSCKAADLPQFFFGSAAPPDVPTSFFPAFPAVPRS